MTAEGHCNIVWGGDFKDTLRFQTSNVSFSFDATFRFADYTNQFFPCLQPSPALTMGGRKKRRFSAESPSTVKVCPKDTRYKLIYNALQRNL